MDFRKLFFLCAIALFSISFAACGSTAPTATPTASSPVATTVTPTAAPPITPTPLSTPAPGGASVTPGASPATPSVTPAPASTPVPGQPVTVSIPALKDTTIFEESGAISNGQGQYLFVGETNNGSARRALLSFDLASAVPSGAMILSAELRLNMSRTTGGGVEIGLHKVTADWGEAASRASGQEGQGAAAVIGDATGSHRLFQSSQWSTPGGDFVPAESARVLIAGTGAYVWESTPAMVADAQSWLDTPSDNFGWLLTGGEGAARTAKRFDSKEHAQEANRPRLIVQYVVPAP